MSTNEEVAVELSLALAREDWARAEALLADDFRCLGDGCPPLDKAEYLHFMRYVRWSGVVEMHTELSRARVQGALVALAYTNTTIHGRRLLGVGAARRRVVATGQLIREVMAGQVTREWQTTDVEGLMTRLCAPVQAQLPNGGDHG